MRTVDVEAAVDAMLVKSPLHPWFRWRSARRLTVLAYHGVDDPAHFERQLDVLVRTTHPVSLDEVERCLDGRRELGARPVLVTFDDGYRSVFDVALPLLRDRGVPAVVFPVAGLLDTDQPFWWTEVEHLATHRGTASEFSGLAMPELLRALKGAENGRRKAAIAELRESADSPTPRITQLRRAELPVLESGGIAVGSHSLTHPCLDRCTDEEISTEIEEAHRILTGALGHPPTCFAYPNGNWDHRVLGAVRRAGYRTGFLFDHRSSPLPPAEPLLTSRVRVSSTTPLNRFTAIVTGLHPAVHHLRGGR